MTSKYIKFNLMVDINLKKVVSEPIELSVGPPYDLSKPSTHRGPTPRMDWTV